MSKRLKALLKKETIEDDIQFNNGHDGLNILALMFREIRLKLSISSMTWSNLIKRYVRDPRIGIEQEPKVRSSEASNLNRGLGAPNLTYLNFMKAMRVISPKSIEFTLTLRYSDRDESSTIKITEEQLFTEHSFNLLKYWIEEFNAKLFKNNSELKKLIKEHFEELESNDGLLKSEVLYFTKSINDEKVSIKTFSRYLSVLKPNLIIFKVDLLFGTKNRTVHEVTMRG